MGAQIKQLAEKNIKTTPWLFRAARQALSTADSTAGCSSGAQIFCPTTTISIKVQVRKLLGKNLSQDG